jgi:hypothetical protein
MSAEEEAMPYINKEKKRSNTIDNRSISKIIRQGKKSC